MPIEGITSTQEIGIAVEEDGTPMIRETPGGNGQIAEAEVTYLARWSDRMALYREMRGGFALWSGLGVPMPGHAYFPDPSLSFSSFGQVRPYGMDKKLIMDPEAIVSQKRWSWSKWCLIPVTYRPLEFGWDAASAAEQQATQIDPQNPILGCRQRIETNNSFIVFDNAHLETLKRRGSRESQNPKKIHQSTDGIPANTISFTLEYPRVPRNPWMFLRPFIGRINAYPLWGLPAEHVLFASASIEAQSTFGGTELAVTLNFIGNLDVSWNETLDDDGIVKPKAFVRRVNEEGEEEQIEYEFLRYPFRSMDLRLVFS